MDPEKRKEEFYVSKDVMVDILSRLPVISLLRFKSVCTQWRDIISSPSFASLHLKCSISNPTRHSILVRTNSKKMLIPFDPLTYSPFSNLDIYCNLGSFGQRVLFVGSINGLLCICGSSGRWICLWNPSTRLFKKIETGINGRSSGFSVGFGHDLIANDYKVVVIHRRRRVTRTGVKVWSANFESWREIKVDCDFTFKQCVCDTMVKGFAYWIVWNGLGSNSKILVASFDMSTEVLRLVPVPQDYYHPDRLYGLIWKEKFALAAFDRTKICQVWTIENDSVGKESWSKKFTFKLDFGFNFYTIDAGNGKLLYNRESRGLVFYDLETTKMKTVEIRKNNYLASGAHYYVESLLSIKGFKRLRENTKKMKRPTISHTF
ncbi:F-box kelch-repeat At3g23880-like [Olea europaea subsp. europaea]|nr:F-box kelch-repeat At3g23880-like [Olea europaea subsp. europaea]